MGTYSDLAPRAGRLSPAVGRVVQVHGGRLPGRNAEHFGVGPAVVLGQTSLRLPGR
jgi:hypothetical protein